MGICCPNFVSALPVDIVIIVGEYLRKKEYKFEIAYLYSDEPLINRLIDNVWFEHDTDNPKYANVVTHVSGEYVPMEIYGNLKAIWCSNAQIYLRTLRSIRTKSIVYDPMNTFCLDSYTELRSLDCILTHSLSQLTDAFLNKFPALESLDLDIQTSFIVIRCVNFNPLKNLKMLNIHKCQELRTYLDLPELETLSAHNSSIIDVTKCKKLCHIDFGNTYIDFDPSDVIDNKSMFKYGGLTCNTNITGILEYKLNNDIDPDSGEPVTSASSNRDPHLDVDRSTASRVCAYSDYLNNLRLERFSLSWTITLDDITSKIGSKFLRHVKIFGGRINDLKILAVMPMLNDLTLYCIQEICHITISHPNVRKIRLVLRINHHEHSTVDVTGCPKLETLIVESDTYLPAIYNNPGVEVSTHENRW